MFRFLKQPSPICIDTKLDLTTSILISLFVFFFLLVFQPFGLNTTEPGLRFIMIGGYAAVCFLILAINLLLIPRLLKKVFSEESWTVYKRILWHIWIVFTIGLGNYLFACLLDVIYGFYTLGINLLISFQIVTLCIAIFPIIFFAIWNQNYWFKKNLKAAEEISNRLQDSDTEIKDLPGSDQKVVLYAENEKEKYEFQVSNLLYISSEGNYVEVYSLNEVVENKLIRNSLKKTEEQLRDYPYIFQCHRAYIVNMNKIRKATGNAQGFKLTLGNVDKRIPVARSYTKQFKELLGIF
jgi:hypothetical protein